MQFDYVTIMLATAAQFIVSAIWYTFLFGRLWGKMHGFDKLPKETQDKMMKGMGPIYGVQFLMTLISSTVLWIFIANLPSDWNAYAMTGFFWLGFVVPTIAGSVLFGGTDPKWIVKKIAVQTGAILLSLEVATLVIKSL
jgi:hypothetical protein